MATYNERIEQEKQMHEQMAREFNKLLAEERQLKPINIHQFHRIGNDAKGHYLRIGFANGVYYLGFEDSMYDDSTQSCDRWKEENKSIVLPIENERMHVIQARMSILRACMEQRLKNIKYFQDLEDKRKREIEDIKREMAAPTLEQKLAELERK